MSPPAIALKHALVYGGAGGLGVRVVAALRAADWRVTSVDFRSNPDASESLPLPAKGFDSLDAAGAHVDSELRAVLAPDAKLDAIVNVAGGWAGGNLLDDDLYKNIELMIAQSVHSSAITAKLAAKHLKDDGLLVLVGVSFIQINCKAYITKTTQADAAKEATPGMIAYGLAKAAVHQLVKSVAAPGSGFPRNATVTALLPVTLDTPMNRKFMPDADTSSWTPLEDLTAKILAWADKKDSVPSGSLLRVLTKGGKTDFVPL
ncbi:hypothetical protein HDU83_002930 [Entophlyctis luteolus]|nr:hypothetical protein HDU83_002930 [Entophlyctis luteolus]